MVLSQFLGAALAAVGLTVLVIVAMMRVAHNARVTSSSPRSLGPTHAAAERLLAAAASGNEASCHAELSGKAETDLLEESDVEGQTALILAAKGGHLGVCELLLERRADVEAADRHLRTALTHAACQKHMDVCRLLLDHGADMAATDCVARDAGCAVS
mmetsp:Transcript_54335/g.117606  ORF Transcript_54335/g.117606 Transcript_54335/m.117606 type:complete len:158 (-) Transcript_54335:59-532(-)